jgi:glucose-1-phosphate cytidylyltransferase
VEAGRGEPARPPHGRPDQGAARGVKVAILAGGLGSRIQEETEIKPKPMVEIGSHPILWHIMKIYGAAGFREFVIALGYKGDYIKRWMMEYSSLQGDLTVSLKDGKVEVLEEGREDWLVSLVDTGVHSQTGGRIKRLAPHLGNATFMLTWGDGVADLDVRKLLEFHRSHGKLATVTAVRPPARFGALELGDDGAVSVFSEKPQLGEGWINGAFFVLEPAVFDYIDNDLTHWEREPLERLAAEGQLMAYRHDSFWQCMDTVRDKVLLEQLWASGQPPWKIWR